MAAAVIGNGLEWYDFILYALFAPAIAATFFPASTHLASLLQAVATFGVGFVVRPIGAVVLGQFADRAGRRPALTVIILLMTVATALIAFTPGWRRIGVAAPLLIVLSRVLQGFSVGGELGSSTALLLESAPAGRRFLYGSLQGSSQSGASLAASAAGILTGMWLGPAAMESWGWRVPFMAGLLIGPVGFWLRTSTAAAEPATIQAETEAVPLAILWRHHRGEVARAIGLVALGTMGTYVLTLNMPSFAHMQLGVPVSATLLCTMAATLASILATTLSGWLADRYGPRPVMLPACIVLGAAIVPGFHLLTAFPGVRTLALVQCCGVALTGLMSGAIYGLMGALFPRGVRSTGLAIAYNLSVLLFGGFAPLITTWLIAATGDRTMPALYMVVGACITALALCLGWPRGRRLPIRQAPLPPAPG